MPRPRKTVDRRSRFGTVTPLPSGKHRARYKTNGGGTQTFNTPTEAWDWLDGIKRAMKENNFVPAAEARQDFGFLATDWLTKRTPNVSHRVAEDYALIVKRIKEWGFDTKGTKLGDKRTVQIDYDDCYGWVDSIGFNEDDEVDDIHMGCGGDRIQKHKMVLSQVITYSQQLKIRTDNPCDYFKTSGSARKPEVFLTHEEVMTLAGLMRPPYGLVIRLAAYSGLRAGEIWDAKIKALDFDRRILQVVSTVGSAKGKGLVSRPAPKNGQWRASRLSTELAADLKKHCEGRGPNELIFLSPEGTQVRHRNFSSRFWDDARDAVNPDLVFHDLRHTCAAFHFKAGANSEEVMRILGHSNPAMVSRYAHIFPEAFGSLVDVLDADIAKARNELSVQRTTDRTTEPVLIPVEV